MTLRSYLEYPVNYYRFLYYRFKSVVLGCEIDQKKNGIRERTVVFFSWVWVLGYPFPFFLELDKNNNRTVFIHLKLNFLIGVVKKQKQHNEKIFRRCIMFQILFRKYQKIIHLPEKTKDMTICSSMI